MQSEATSGTLISNAINAGYLPEEIEEKEVTPEEFQSILINQPKDIEQVRGEKLSELYKLFSAAKSAIVWHNNMGFDADTSSQIDFLSAKNRAKDAYDSWDKEGEEPKIYYRVWVSPTEKQFLPQTHSAFVAVMEEGALQQTQAFLHFDKLRTNLKNATTIEQIQAITW